MNFSADDMETIRHFSSVSLYVTAFALVASVVCSVVDTVNLHNSPYSTIARERSSQESDPQRIRACALCPFSGQETLEELIDRQALSFTKVSSQLSLKGKTRKIVDTGLGKFQAKYGGWAASLTRIFLEGPLTKIHITGTIPPPVPR